MKRLSFTVLLSLTVLFVFSQTADVVRIGSNIQFLASDSLKGRGPGTPEDKVAAEFILAHFQKAGLQPLFNDGFQKFEIVKSVESDSATSISFNGQQGKLFSDFSPFGFSASEMHESEIVFVGYGFDFESDTLSWNDYEGMDVEGKWVLILRGDPEIDNAFSNFVAHSDERKKVMLAKDHGAKGVIFVAGEKMAEKDVLVSLRLDRSGGSSDIPVIQVKRAYADSLLLPDNTSTVMLEQKLNEEYAPHSFNLEGHFKAEIKLRKNKVYTQNIVAQLEGTDPVLKDQYIVVGAHYDHLGMGGEGTSSRMKDTLAPHNGADDNASGVAGVMELAYLLSEKPTSRSIIFIAFGGEEMGLLGSKYFVKYPPVDLSSITAMINFDMIGRLDPVSRSLSVSGTGTAVEIDSIIQDISSDYDILIKGNPDGYGPSDHSSFYMNTIPVLFFSTGAHPDYHTPDDDFEKLDIEAEADIIQLSFDIIHNIASREQALTYQEASGKSRSRGGRTLKVTLGIVPDFSNMKAGGLGVDGVKDGGPAHAAGMVKGDLIISLNGERITNIYDYMYRLAKINPGETVIVEVERHGETKVLLVQL